MAIQGKKIPQKTWDQFLEVFRERATSISGACRILDISAHAVYDHCGRDPEFAEQLDSIRDRIRRPFAEDMLFSLIGEKNLGAIKFYLSHHGGKRWNDTRVVPLLVRHEMQTSGIVREVQGMPTAAEQIAAIAYELAMDYPDNKLPDTLRINTSSVKELVKRYDKKDPK